MNVFNVGQAGDNNKQCPKQNKQEMFSKVVGHANETMVTVCDVEIPALIDSGSMVSTVSEEFYRSLNPRPELHEDFRLSLQGPDGKSLKYFGIIIVKIELSFIDEPLYLPALVVPTTEYNLRVPIIVGT